MAVKKTGTVAKSNTPFERKLLKRLARLEAIAARSARLFRAHHRRLKELEKERYDDDRDGSGESSLENLVAQLMIVSLSKKPSP